MSTTRVANPTIAGAAADGLADQINAEHQAVEQAATSALYHARRAEALLKKVKNITPHGTWLGWVDRHCDCDVRTAQRYIRIAEWWHELESNTTRVSYLSLRGALELTAPRDDDDEPEPAQEDAAPGPADGPEPDPTPAATRAPVSPTAFSAADAEPHDEPEPEREPETGESLDEVMPDDLDEATIYRQENERLEKRNAELEALVESLQAQDQAGEIRKLHDQLARLDGRLGQAVTTAHEASKDARRYLKVLDRLGKILGVQRHSEIVAAVEWQARQLQELAP